MARRYSLNTNLIFKWLKEPRFAPDGAEAGEMVFLPVEVAATDMALAPLLPGNRPIQHPAGSRIEIALSNGHRLTIEGGFSEFESHKSADLNR